MNINAKPKTEDEKLVEDGKYYDILYDFTKTVVKINDKAVDGEPPKGLQTHCIKLLPAFILLCGEKLTEQLKPKPRTVLQSNLRVRDNWGLCPKCGGKCIRTRDNTILVNFPMFCKHCKSESVVTWKLKV